MAFFSAAADPDALCREVVEASTDCFKIMDLDGRMLFMNRNGRCLMEIEDFSSVHLKSWPELWPAEERPKVVSALNAARAGDTAQFTAFCPTACGTAKWWNVIVYAVHDEDGEPAQLVAVSRDVTSAIRVQSELEAMITELRGLLQAGDRLRAA